MALATRCPHCQTTFRVAHDQLKLRAGLVRCGACKEIFNGVEHLLAASVPPQAAGPQDTSAAHATAVLPAAHEKEAALSPDRPPAVENTAPPASEIRTTEIRSTRMSAHASAEPADADAGTAADPLQRMTLMDFSAWQDDELPPASPQSLEDKARLKTDDPGAYSQTEEPADTPDELDRAIEDLQRRPWRRKKSSRNNDDDIAGDDDTTEPDFVRKARRQHRIGRTVRALMNIGIVFLLIAFAGQAAYTFRNQIAARMPQATSMLVEACEHIGCDIGLPAQIDAVSIESNELQTLGPDQGTFVLNILMRNRASTAQAWPSIELTLNDNNEKAIARRVFSPREYIVPATSLKKGFAASSEQSVKVFFELSQLKASGYRVYLFYP